MADLDAIRKRLENKWPLCGRYQEDFAVAVSYCWHYCTDVPMLLTEVDDLKRELRSTKIERNHFRDTAFPADGGSSPDDALLFWNPREESAGAAIVRLGRKVERLTETPIGRIGRMLAGTAESEHTEDD
jgi:hypothetical protein